MGWCTTGDLDRFLTAAGGYLRSRAAENTLLLSAAQAARDAGAAHRDTDPGPLFGWWEVPDGSGTLGAFLHDPSVPLLIAGRAPEMAAALAASLAKAGRYVCGVDAQAAAADAFAAAWSQRAGVDARVHRHSLVYRLTGARPGQPGPAGRLRIATVSDRGLLVAWLTAFGTEVGDLGGSPDATAEELIRYGGAMFWEVAGHPVALATVTRPVARTVRVSIVYTPPERRRNGYATAVTLAASRAELAREVSEVVMIVDTARPQRQAARLGYELIGERVVVRFGTPTGPMPRVPTGPMPRTPTGPMPRLRG